MAEVEATASRENEPPSSAAKNRFRGKVAIVTGGASGKHEGKGGCKV